MTIVIVGASLAGVRTAQALRAKGSVEPITMIGSESRQPYDRPPLSKSFLLEALAEDAVDLVSKKDLAALDIDFRLGQPAIGLRVAEREVCLADGSSVSFDSLVVATGSVPRPLQLSTPTAGVHELRTMDDAIALRRDLVAGARVVIIGGGVVGAELASTASQMGLDVTVVEPADSLMERVLGVRLGSHLSEVHRRNGVHLKTGATVTELRGRDRVESVRLSDGTTLSADVVVVAVGSLPATDWLADSGLQLANGVEVDAELRALGTRNIYAAGDVARWQSRRFAESIRAEHWTNATEQAQVVATNILGGSAEHDPIPYVWSDQFGLRLQLAGRIPPDGEIRYVEGDDSSDRFVAVVRDGVSLSTVIARGSVRGFVKYRAMLSQGATWESIGV
ncbi:NAD(P)/FAD-dependent oxidoreductase [Rhodococcus opacus]